MRTGVIIPTFRETPDDALSIARRADELGIDGVFCYDHLWPMGEPNRPALAPFPVLAAAAATTARVHVGPLVARVGLVADETLLAELDALAAVAPNRVIAALGTGDRLSAAENDAYGIPPADADARRAALARCARMLHRQGHPVWVGGGNRATNEIAEAEGVAVNLWAASPGTVAGQARRCEVTWAGPVPSDGDAGLVPLLRGLHEAGATWAVLGWPVSLDALVRAAEGLPGRQPDEH